MMRPDRDEYITVLWDNIRKDYHYAYKKWPNTLTYGVPYDCKSIMHYPTYAFAKAFGKPTMKSKVYTQF